MQLHGGDKSSPVGRLLRNGGRLKNCLRLYPLIPKDLLSFLESSGKRVDVCSESTSNWTHYRFVSLGHRSRWPSSGAAPSRRTFIFLCWPATTAWPSRASSIRIFSAPNGLRRF